MCYCLRVLVAALIAGFSLAQQPRVATMEMTPSIRGCGIISLPQGSPWCQGRPTTWIPGHKDFVEDRPNCLVDGRWQKSATAVMDTIDRLNQVDNPTVQDRHDCGVMDVNNDGLPDIYCLVGANKGEGLGFNELYLTRRDGSLFKIRRHGLQRFPGMRTRHTTILKGANNTEFVFISASFGPRADGMSNRHAMFRKNGKWSRRPWRRFFDHVRGPWQTHTNSTCAITADVNRDGLDDLVICNRRIPAFYFEQRPNGSFKASPWTGGPTSNWRSAKIGDLTGDGIPDLVAVYHDEYRSFLRVFRGIPQAPYFDFNNLGYFSRALPYAAPDVELIDANRDGILDIYVVQADERRKAGANYCGGPFVPAQWWPINPVSPMTPPQNYIPPPDMAPDLLLVGNPGAQRMVDRFRTVQMQHREPGCGYFVKKFNDRSLVLVQGGFVRPGHQLLLQW